MRADDLLILQMIIVNPHNPIVFKLIQNRRSLNSTKITLIKPEKNQGVKISFYCEMIVNSIAS